MITKTGKVNPYLETDNEAQKELVNLYNAWSADTCFLSNCSWIDTNENWKKMKVYCMQHKDLVKDFWMEMYGTFGEVGNFTFMLHYLFPNTVEVHGYCPLSDIEKTWMISFIAGEQKVDTSTSEKVLKN